MQTLFDNMLWRVILVTLVLSPLTYGQYYKGILINGPNGGTQLYDPFNAPHVRGNLSLGLQNSSEALGSAAVIQGQVAYFTGSKGGAIGWTTSISIRSHPSH